MAWLKGSGEKAFPQWLVKMTGHQVSGTYDALSLKWSQMTSVQPADLR